MFPDMFRQQVGGEHRPFPCLLYTSWTVTFRDEDGSVLKTENVDEGTGATAPTAPIKDGYRFTGWDVTFNNITDDTVVTAQYEKEETAVPPAEPEQPQTPEQGGEMNNTVTEEKTQTGVLPGKNIA